MLKRIYASFFDGKLKKGYYTLILRLFGVGILFLFTIFFTRNYDASLVGDFELSRMIFLVLGAISLIGLEVSILYFVGKLKSLNAINSTKALYFKTLKIVFLSSCILLTLFFTIPKDWVLHYANPSIYSIIHKCILVLFFNAITILNAEILRTQDKVIWSELHRNIFKFIPFYFGLIFLFYTKEFNLIINFYIYGFIFLAIISTTQVLYFYRGTKPDENHIEFSFKEIVKTTYPFTISSLIFYLLLTIDILIIQNKFGSEKVALYAICIKIITFQTMVTLSFNTSIATRVSELFNAKKQAELQATIRKTAWIIFAINIGLGLSIITFPKHILRFFGQEYNSASQALIILTTAQMVVAPISISQMYLNMTGKQNWFKSILVIALLINVISNIILIPRMEIIGAAISYFITLAFWNITTVIIAYKKDRIKLFIH